ncbi:MAG: acetyl-CoA synthase subunit gamma [Deltaproteobacteria bacterium]|nr:acetyl-CoA synthase subunit gamma [Deltaproteobacteria bacterium]
MTPAGERPRVSSDLSWADRWGAIKARWGVGRMSYTVEPGLYALNRPDPGSPVLVTANYKMSFDQLRRSLPGRDAWILVLDTKGINVWCAAGKGTFGNGELGRRLAESGLAEIVAHREVILPQLSGPGIAAHKVKKATGFRAVFGPVRAQDLPSYLDAGKKTSPEMRLKTFSVWERAVLIPVELVSALKVTLLVGGVMFLAAGLGGPAGFWANAAVYGLFAVAALLGAVLAGAIITPLLLPWLPGRAFSLKGTAAGLAVALVLAWVLTQVRNGPVWPIRLEMAAWLLLVPALAAFLGMNFTGSSTYTSLSGVKKEVRRGLPFQIGAGVAGLGLWFGSRLLA